MPLLDPLHPAVVHFPLVLGVLLAPAALAALLASRRPGAGRAAWRGVALMALLLSVSAWVSVETGEEQEDRVERVVGDAPIHTHEEAAEGMFFGSGLVTAVVFLGLLPGRWGRGARLLTVPGTLAVLVLAIQVGDTGGALVYRHGAASAYVEGGNAASPVRAERSQKDGDQDH